MLTHTIRYDRRGAPHPVEGASALVAALRRRSRGSRDGFVWLEAWAPDDAEMAQLATLLGLDPRSAAEAAGGGQQPKIQRFEHHLTIVAWTLEFRSTHPRIAIGEVFLYVTRDALLVVRRSRLPDATRQPSREADDGVEVTGGALGAAFLLLDDLCAQYADLADRIEDELEEIEREVYDDAIVESRTRIYRLRQQIGKVGRAVSSLARSLESSRDHFASVSVAGHEVEPYVRDLLDRLTGTAEVLRDQSSTLDAVVASHENNAAARQNDDVRRISAIAALLSVPALTAGIFGMNFADLPLVKVAYGWTWVLAGAVLVDVVVFLLFRRRGWL